MKNREKFRKEIIKSARTPEERLNVCEFIRINALRISAQKIVMALTALGANS